MRARPELVTATPFHAEALAALHAAAFPPGERWGASAMALQLGLAGSFGWIAPEGGMILARATAGEAEVLTLAVAPARRRGGLGRSLLSAAMRTAGERGAAEMFLEVAADNAAAQALYAAGGFRAVGRRAGYYRDGVDAVVLRAPTSCGLATT